KESEGCVVGRPECRNSPSDRLKQRPARHRGNGTGAQRDPAGNRRPKGGPEFEDWPALPSSLAKLVYDGSYPEKKAHQRESYIGPVPPSDQREDHEVRRSASGNRSRNPS